MGNKTSRCFVGGSERVRPWVIYQRTSHEANLNAIAAVGLTASTRDSLTRCNAYAICLVSQLQSTAAVDAKHIIPPLAVLKAVNILSAMPLISDAKNSLQERSLELLKVFQIFIMAELVFINQRILLISMCGWMIPRVGMGELKFERKTLQKERR